MIQMFHQILLSSLTTLALSLSSTMSHAAHPLDLFRGESHPTEEEFREEMRAADVIIRGQVKKICRVEKSGYHPEVVAKIDVLRTYKGKLPDMNPCIRMEIIGNSRMIMGVPDTYVLTPHLPDIDDEVILPIFLVQPRVHIPPVGQRLHYMVPEFYHVAADGRVSSNVPFPPDLARQSSLVQIEAIILEEIKRSLPNQQYKPGKVLFFEDFEDGSLAGWTFLQGVQDPRPDGTETWIAPNYVFRWDSRAVHKAKLNPKTGLYYFKHRDRETLSEFGIVNGRLRLRTSRVLQHITAVIGDPEWTNYQIDVDLFTFSDPSNPTERRGNYLKFGPYGRVHVPNFPETKGEHSFVSVEVDTFGNYDLSERSFGNSAIQIRCKYPEHPVVSRDHSRVLRKTKILDFDAWSFKDGKKLHLTAKFYNSQVEGWIDGEKVLEGTIPVDHPGAAKGRIALWTFETWSEFDNLKVTQLVLAK